MTATLSYRISAGLLLLFAAGHTLGFLRFKPPTPEGLAVQEAMTKVHFELQGKSFTYAGFYTGFGLFVAVFLVFAAFLAWHLGNLAARDPQAIGPVGWALFAVQLATLALSWIYFAPVTVWLSAVVAVFVGWAALLAA